jgi:aldehyde:ferredoxin oxidoreductase
MFSTMLKMAGWDGVAVIGKADSPVYINIVDDKVTLEDAKALWGLTTWECQEEIWKRSGVRYGQEWQKLDNGFTLQRPAIVTTGPAGENFIGVARSFTVAAPAARADSAASSVKNLKAVAVIGTGASK